MYKDSYNVRITEFDIQNICQNERNATLFALGEADSSMTMIVGIAEASPRGRVTLLCPNQTC